MWAVEGHELPGFLPLTPYLPTNSQTPWLAPPPLYISFHLPCWLSKAVAL